MANEKPANQKNRAKPNIKEFIKSFIKEYCEFKECISDPELEYGYLFHYPEGKPPEPTGRPYLLVKEKDVDFITITTWATFSESHESAFQRLTENKKRRLAHDLQKIFLLKEFDFVIELLDVKYKIAKRIFIEKPNFKSKEKLFNTIQSLLATMSYSFKILDETLLGFGASYHHKSTNTFDSRRLYKNDGTYPTDF